MVFAHRKGTSILFFKNGDIWGLPLSEIIHGNDWNPSGALLNSDGHQLWNNAGELDGGGVGVGVGVLSCTHSVALSKSLGRHLPFCPAGQPTTSQGC